MFKTLDKYFNNVKGTFNDNIYVQDWTSDGSSNLKISYLRTMNNANKRPRLDKNGKIRLEFKRDEFLKQNEADDLKKIVNIYIVYEMTDNGPPGGVSNTFGLHNFLFGATVLKPGKYSDEFSFKNEYSGYRIGFSSKYFKHPEDNKDAYSVVIIGCDQSKSKHINN